MGYAVEDNKREAFNKRSSVLSTSSSTFSDANGWQRAYRVDGSILKTQSAYRDPREANPHYGKYKDAPVNPRDNHYKTLGVDRTATKWVIKTNFVKLSVAYTNKGDQASYNKLVAARDALCECHEPARRRTALWVGCLQGK